MKKYILILLIIMIVQNSLFPQKTFKQSQLNYARVKMAYNEKESLIVNHLKSYGIDLKNIEILLIAYKKERQLQLWAKNKSDNFYKKIKVYQFSSFSGTLGPKRKQGDFQIPEGFYLIDRFNPLSSFYLSLGINYPNESDRKKSKVKDLGGDVFIHGDNVTIGCIPITDDKIKELYIYAVEAKNNGQKRINVAIFPAELDNQNFQKLHKEFSSNKALLLFWENLKEVYDYFQLKKQYPKISVDESGNYIYK